MNISKTKKDMPKFFFTLKRLSIKQQLFFNKTKNTLHTFLTKGDWQEFPALFKQLQYTDLPHK